MVDNKRKAALAAAAQTWDNCYEYRSTERWQRVTRCYRCPICGHSDWCRFTSDLAIVGCMRQDRGAFRTVETAIGSMFLYRLGERCPSSLRIPPCQGESKPAPTIAAADHRHTLYQGFLERLTLSGRHAAALRGDRKLSDETVTRNLYATVPTADILRGVMAEIAAEWDLSGVPGFFRERDAWRCVARAGELLIPVRDHRQRILALLRATGGANGRPKYLWLSDADRGPSCGTPAHFARQYLAELYDDPVIVTEGVLKADIIAERLHCAVIGMAGVGSFRNSFGRELRVMLPSVTAVRVAFDADERRNLNVRQALIRLLRSLQAAGYDVTLLQWDERSGKGLDDVLNAGGDE